MAISIYPAVIEFSINAKKNYGIIFFAQRSNVSSVNDDHKWQYNDTPLCPSSTHQFSFVPKSNTAVIPLATAFLANSICENMISNICS
jgi:hypothetical protein